MGARVLSDQALNRALLARQGLLERRPASPPAAIEAIGAMQAQHWPALPVGLWSRSRDFAAADLYQAFAAGELRLGILLRGTLHAVTAGEYPAYAAVTRLAGHDQWRRTKAPLPEAAAAFRKELLDFAATPRSGEEVSAFAAAWFAGRPDAIDEAEAEFQQEHGWRPVRRSSDFVRVPLGRDWDARTPAGYLAGPPADGQPAGDAAVDTLTLAHLRAFGPATAADVAYWLGLRVPRVRDALDRVGEKLIRFSDEAGRDLYDVPDGPLPDPTTPAPARFLPSFDSVLLAYAPEQRARLGPKAVRDAIYTPRNLRILPSFLVDGVVAGTWESQARRRLATVTLRPLVPLSRPAMAELTAEAEALARFSHPTATSCEVVFDG